MKFLISIIFLSLLYIQQCAAGDNFNWNGGVYSGIALNAAPGISKPNFKTSLYNGGLIAAYFEMGKNRFSLYASLEYNPNYFAYQYTHPANSNYSLSHSEVLHSFNLCSQVSGKFRLTGKSKIEMGAGTKLILDSKPKAKGQTIYKSEFDTVLQRHNNIPVIGVRASRSQNTFSAVFVSLAYHRYHSKYPWFVRVKFSTLWQFNGYDRHYLFYAYEEHQNRTPAETILLLHQRSIIDCTWGIQLWSSGNSKRVKQ
ncbi:MAG: hypothetical protein BGO09_13480 [Bacteroidetes bacterium 47-18]|nr:MAG: hypothetical protein BGO09_13480 [Bacteroidetes bacterium 47-18]